MALTPESITETALEVLSRFGMGDLSMRRLARELDVQPSALYWHVKNKQELFALVARRFTEQVDTRCPAAAKPAPVVVALALREVLLSYRDGAEIHLLAYALEAERAVPEALAAALDGHRLAATMGFVLGQVAVEQNRSMLGVDDPDAEDTFIRGLRALLGT
ncbi:AcrR family transcriptional regulator [Brevibacterium pityocampae]